MVFLELVGVLIGLSVLVLLLTQILLPLIFNTPFYPWFRRRPPEYAEVVAVEHEVEVQTERVRLQRRLFELNKEREALEKEIAEHTVAPTEPVAETATTKL